MEQLDSLAIWRVVRINDGLLLGRYFSKPQALAAAVELSRDGEHYGVVKHVGVTKPDPIGVVLSMRKQ